MTSKQQTLSAMTATTKPLDLAQFAGHTPGPWRFETTGTGVRYIEPRVACVFSNEDGKNNAFFLAQADASGRLLAAAPALLAECRRLQAENERLRKALGMIIHVDASQTPRAAQAMQSCAADALHETA